MRKLIVFNMITLDGFFEGPNHTIDWHTVDEEFNQFAINQLKEADALLFGRVTYDLMAGYWPTEAAMSDDPQVAQIMNTVPKYVFSNSLQSADWHNTTLVSGDMHDQIPKIKDQPGKDILIFGSGKLTSSLLDLGLIDEIRLMLSPILLGQGLTITSGLKHQIPLKLLKSKIFTNGNILLTYEIGH